MTRSETIARQLAAELSDNGEQDWRGFVPLARQVHDRLEQQFALILGADANGPASFDR